MEPTEEQDRALTLFRTGRSMVIEAGAGAGKTTTLRYLAFDAHRRQQRGRYLAFNRPIVRDVNGKLPKSCPASTAHGLAFRAVGNRYGNRLRDSARMRGEHIAQRLDVDPFVVVYGKQRKTLAPGWLAGVVMRGVTRFCQSADEEPGRQHVPYVDGIDVPDEQGRRTFAVNNELAAFLAPAVAAAWADLSNVHGFLSFDHLHYLKVWQLTHPHIDVDYLLFDEAQDANPVMAAVVDEQQHAQRVYVGDANQAIYEWTGAVNAIAAMKANGLTLAQLTESFRFGPAIAEAANEILAKLRADLVLRGQTSLGSTRGPLDDDAEPGDAIMCRTNAGAMLELLASVRRGRKAHLVGEGREVLSFARAAGRLKAGEKVWHRDLACFDTWGEVLDYVQNDQLGAELAMMVRLVEEFGVKVIVGALDDMPDESDDVVTVTTAHKSKGREWRRVIISDDFADAEQTVGELRLRYVACTRPTMHLDDSVFTKPKEEATHVEPAR